MEKVFKLFDKGTVREKITALLNEGFMLANSEETVGECCRRGLKNYYFVTSTAYFSKTGQIRRLTKKELKEILAGNGVGRLSAVNYYYGNGSFYADLSSIDDEYARAFGVKKR